MKVYFDPFKQSEKRQNINFEGYRPVKDDKGNRIYEFNYPYDSSKYDCYLEVCSVETDDYNNYYIVEGLQNNLSDDGYLKLDPNNNRINLAETFNLSEDEPFAYHYALVPKGADRTKPGVTPLYKIDAGDFIDSIHGKGDHEIYNIVTSGKPYGYNSGSMKLLMPDFYNPMWTYDDKGNIIKNKKYNELLHVVKTFSNKIGGNIAGIEKDVRDGKFDGYAKIISTPLFTDDSLSSHAYWNKNCMQMAQSLGNINNYASLQREMFKKGINFVSDGAYVNEGLEGVHFKHVLKWGEKSPFFNWFKAQNLKNSPLALGVFSKNTDFISHKLVNSPYSYKQNLKTGKIEISRNKLYNSKEPTYLQIFDNRLVSDKYKNDSQHLIKAYDILNTDNVLDINTHDDTIIPYSFEIDPETYNKNIEKLNEFNKSRSNHNLYETIEYAANIVFPANNQPKKLREIKQKLTDATDQIEKNNSELRYADKVNLIMQTAKKDYNLNISTEEENKLRNTILKLKNTVPLDSYLGTRFVSKFENFILEEKIEGNFNTWDANTDIAKLNYLYSNADTENIKLSYKTEDQKNAQKALEQASYEVQDYAITSASYWTGKTSDILNLYVAQQLKFNPLDNENPKNIYNKILKNIEEGNLPKKLKSELNTDIIKNVLTGAYDLKGAQSDIEYKKYLLANLMDFPLDSIEFGDNLTAVLASPYITKRATSEETLGKTRYDMYLQGNPHLISEYTTTYKTMDNIYNKEIYNFAYEIIDNLNDIMPQDSKIFDGYNTTIYGRYVIPYLANIIVKHAFIKALAPKTSYTSNENTGEIIYDYNALKNTNLESLGFVPSSPQDEAKEVLHKLQSGIKKISNQDKKELVNILFNTLKGTNVNSFKFAEMITDRLNAGLDWRIDATKDIGDIDSVKGGYEKIENVWTGVTEFWKNFTNAVHEKNPNAYIVAEITDEGDMYARGHGDRSHKYNSPQEMIKKFLRETNMTSTPNYSQFYSSILNLFGKHFEKYEKHGTDYNNPDVSQRFIKKCWEIFEYMPYMGILNSYNFIGNHDKPRVLQGLVIDTDWYQTNLNDTNNKEFRKRAYRILHDKYLGPIADPEKFRNPDDLRKQEESIIDSEKLSTASVKALAMAEALQNAFDKSITEKYPHSKNSALNEKVFSAIFKSISDLANGKYKGEIIQADSFGVKPVDVAVDIIIDQAQNQHGLNLSQSEIDSLKATTLKYALGPALKKLQAMMETLSILPGLPTLYAGDDLGATGYESESKNIYLQNRSFVHNEWLDKNNKNYEFIQKHYENMNNIMKMRGRPELHALNDGAPFILDVQDGRLNNNEHVDVTAILRQGTDNSIVISLLNPTGINHNFNGEYNPQQINLERIDIPNNDYKSPRSLTKGITPGTILYNAKDENDRYIVKEYNNAIFIKKLVRLNNGSEKEENIKFDGTTMTLYSKPVQNKTRRLYNNKYYFGPTRNTNKGINPKDLGNRLSVISVAE